VIGAFLFDLDGVLTDTSELHFQAWKRLADELGIPFTREDNEALRGISRGESLKLLLKGRRVSERQAQEWADRKNSYYQAMIEKMTPADLLPGARELLLETRAAKIKIAVVSSSRNARRVADRLELWPYIDALVDGASGARSKPAPDLFLLGAQQVGVPPAECVVFEDAASGIEAAKAGGMRAVGLGPIERVGKADLVLTSLEGVHLKDILAGLGEAGPPN